MNLLSPEAAFQPQNKTDASPAVAINSMGSLEQELVRVVKTLEELQGKYLAMLEESEDDHEREDSGDTLYDYQLLADKLGEWINKTDGSTRMSPLLHRSMVKCSDTSHASLLIPVLTIMKQITEKAKSRDIKSQSSHLYKKLATNLCSKVLLSVDALDRANSESVFYSKSEAKEIFEKSTAVLNAICENNTDITRYILEKYDDFKESLFVYLQHYENVDSRNLFEAVESEEECLKENEKRAEATLLIQATVRMYQQKSRWRKLKIGIIAFQRLLRKKTSMKQYLSGKEFEETRFRNELEEVIERRKFMEV